MLNYQKNEKETTKNLQKNENMSKENLLESRRKFLIEKLKELKLEYNTVFENVGEIQNEIINNTAEIEVLENYHKYCENLKVGISNSKKLEMIRNMKSKLPNNQDAIFSIANDLQREINLRERKLSSLKEENEDKKIEKEDLMQISKEIKDQIKVYKEELDSIKKKLLLHYHILLSEGTDTRSEGLIWIIKSIWNLGENVIMSYLPSYLDEKCIKFLFFIAHKDFELIKMNEDLDGTKMQLKSSLSEFGISSRSKNRKQSIIRKSFEDKEDPVNKK
jgi:hypothetical protein